MGANDVTEEEMQLAQDQYSVACGINPIRHSGLNDFLAHYGIKGMKWGIRRGDTASSSTPKPPAHDDAVKVKTHKEKLKKGGTDALSNAELQELVSRMNLEKQLTTLQPPTGAKKAQKILGDVLLNAGKQQMNRVVTDAMAKQVGIMLKKATDR